MSVSQYLKAIVAALIAGLGAAQAVYAVGHPTTYQWITIGLTTVIALGGVWAVPNAPKPPAK